MEKIYVMNKELMIAYTGFYCGNSTNPPRLPWHSHNCPELVFVTEGENRTMFQNGAAFHCTRGCMLITPAGLVHRQIDLPYCEVYYAGFEPGGAELDLSLRMLKLENDPFFFVWMKQIHDLLADEQDMREAGSLLRTLLLRLGKLDRERNFTEQKHPAICRAVRFIAEHFREPVNQEKIAEKAGLSVSRLNVLFRRDFGITPVQMLIRKRMEYARMLLADPMKTVTEVAQATGYSDMNYFVRAFRKRNGITPAAFRKNAGRNIRDLNWHGNADVPPESGI